jgi:hypothetical protein
VTERADTFTLTVRVQPLRGGPALGAVSDEDTTPRGIDRGKLL